MADRRPLGGTCPSASWPGGLFGTRGAVLTVAEAYGLGVLLFGALPARG